MILLYANPSEVKYVNYKSKYCIGLMAENMGKHNNDMFLKNLIFNGNKEVILFDCSGWRGSRKSAEFDKLYHWDRTLLVDMESEIVEKLCKNLGVKFTSIRYIIDLDRGKVMPTGINHFWRKFQHRRMQLKFNKYLENLK